jgi:chromobox protein 5
LTAKYFYFSFFFKFSWLKNVFFHFQNEYLLKWKGYSNSHNRWTPEDNLNCDDLIDEFETRREAEKKRQRRRTKSKARTLDVSTPQRKQRTRANRSKITSSSPSASAHSESAPLNESELPLNNSNKETSSSSSDSSSDEADSIPQEIVGAFQSHGLVIFCVRWQGTGQISPVPAEVANIKWPQMVIAFYERRTTWNDRNPIEE